MNFGVSTASFYPMIPEKAIELLRQNNVVNMEIFINTICEMEKNFLSEQKKIINGHGQKVLSVHPFTSGLEPFMLFTDYERRFKDAIEAHKYYFEAMNILGAEIFVFHGARREFAIEDEKYYERFAALRDAGKQFGVTVAQENVERCKSCNLNFLVNMIKYLNGDVSIVFDNKQALRSGIQYDEFINAVGNNIAHIHLSDNNEQSDCIGLGKGTLDIKRLLDIMSKYNNNCNVIIENYFNMLDGIEDIFSGYELLINL